MNEFLFQIAFGIRSIPKKYQELFLRLQKFKCIQKKENGFILDSNFVIGTIDITKNQSVFLCDLSKKQDYRVLNPIRNLQKGDFVLAKLVRQKAKIKARIIDVLSSWSCALFYLDLYKGTIVAYRLYDIKPYPLKLPISQKSLRQLPRYCVIYLDLKTKKIIDILGVLDDPKIDEKIMLYFYNHPFDFSQECKKYADSFGVKVYKELYENRIDLTHLPFYTIDPVDAKDHDDAIYYDFKEKTLYVAIADVSEYVALDSILDNEALERGFSVYFPNRSYPMLPENLSQNICSLKEGEVRLAFVWKIKFDNKNQVKKSHLFEAIICNHQNVSYEMVDRMLDSKKHDIKKEIASNIKKFYQIALKLKKQRLAKGFDFSSDEVVLSLDKNEEIVSTKPYQETKSHCIVEEAMLLANKQSALMLRDFKTGIYRIHQPIKDEKLRMLFFDLKNLGFEIKGKDFHTQILNIQAQAKEKGLSSQIDKIIIKAQNKAEYSTALQEHFALGFEAYTHFTSPIRRYSDLALHRVLKEILRQGKRVDFLLNKMHTYCAYLNEQERKIAKIEAGFRDRKYTHWARKNIGKQIRAQIIDERYPVLALALGEIQGARIIIDENPRELLMFEEVEVEIIDVDFVNARIYARLSSKE
ncbi:MULTISPECIES: RNB domain-containing ribonuclease [unclassified Helicobacter]|uniref:RNB domain-containing ribonuclease n=1 Tax=unclassified Helicobacter TaxID=2593540 RepID=UPI000CF14A4C|nr:MULTISPECIES: ribonuclease R family protein [unclassified Helicobacter]